MKFKLTTPAVMWLKSVLWLFRWKNGIFKTLIMPAIIYTLLFYSLGFIYKFALDGQQKEIFERISLALSRIPETVMTALISVFVSTQILTRWWSLYSTIPGTGKIITIAMFSTKQNVSNREAWLRTLTRYLILSWLLFMRTMSNPIRRKYATLESIERSGLLLPHERDMLKVLGKFEDETKHSLYVVNWAMALVRKAKDDGFFETPVDASRVLDSLLVFKKSCSSILKFKFIRFPPQFLHLISIMIFFFGVVTLMGRQFVDPQAKDKVLFIEATYYVPVLPTFHYLVFLTWLVVVIQAEKGLGEDNVDLQMFEVFENHVEAADNLLRLFVLNQFNPIEKSLVDFQHTLFRSDPAEKNHPLKLELNQPLGETKNTETADELTAQLESV